LSSFRQPQLRLRRVDDTPANDEFENIAVDEPLPPDGPDRRPIVLGLVAFIGGILLLVACLIVYSFTRGQPSPVGTATQTASATEELFGVTKGVVLTATSAQSTEAVATVAPPTLPPVRTATISELIGQVQTRLSNDGAWNPATEGAPLEPGTTILTGQDSHAKITLPEGNIIRLSSQTQFTLVEDSGTDTDPIDRTQLDFGKVWAVVTTPLNNGLFQIQLPIGIAAVHGSFLSAEYNSTTNGIVVSCLEGSCHYENANGALDFTNGQQAVSRDGAAPTLEPISSYQLGDWNIQNVPEIQTLTPPPTETLAPTDTPISTPTKTLVPSRTPVPSRTLAPSNTPRPTRTPTLTRTPRPTSTASNTPTSTATVGAPAKLVFTVQPPSSAPGGTAFTVKVAVQDNGGATVVDATDSVSLSIGTNGGGGTLAGVTTVGPVNGVATFQVSLDKGGQYTLVASAPGLPTTLSAVFNIETSNAQLFIITGLSNDVSAGQPVTITVNAIEGNGNVSQNYLGTIHFQSSDGLAILPPDYTFNASDRGSHAFSVVFKTTGSQTLKVTDIQRPALAGYAGVNVK